MDQGPHEDREAALRPLRMVGGVVTTLRAGTLTGEAERSGVIQVASAVEMSLRRILRDHPDIAIPVRLRALAPDELGSDEVLAELRQHERISMELAASVHDLLEVRRRLKEGAPSAPGDAALAHRVAGRLEQEALSGLAGAPTAPPLAPATLLPETEVTPDAAPTRAVDWRRWRWPAAAALILLLLVPLGYWLSTRGDPGMEQGIALYRSGAYADAASHFFRYAEANPDDPTPRLFLARIHRQLERYDLARPEIDAALELAPDDPAVHTELGLLLSDTGQYELAVAPFREAIRRDPGMEVAWVGLVRALRADGRADAAEAVLNQAPAEVRALLARPADAAVPR